MIGDPEEPPVDLRCSVAVLHDGECLLVHRLKRDDWVLPGGHPRPAESMVACARREAREETGLVVHPTRCAFVLEVVDPDQERRLVELVFLAHVRDRYQVTSGEPGTTAEWMPFAQLPRLNLRPPIAGYLPALAHGNRGTAPYLGNMWRPDQSAQWGMEPIG